MQRSADTTRVDPDQRPAATSEPPHGHGIRVPKQPKPTRPQFLCSCASVKCVLTRSFHARTLTTQHSKNIRVQVWNCEPASHPRVFRNLRTESQCSTVQSPSSQAKGPDRSSPLTAHCPLTSGLILLLLPPAAWRWQGSSRPPVAARCRSGPLPCGNCLCPASSRSGSCRKSTSQPWELRR